MTSQFVKLETRDHGDHIINIGAIDRVFKRNSDGKISIFVALRGMHPLTFEGEDAKKTWFFFERVLGVEPSHRCETPDCKHESHTRA